MKTKPLNILILSSRNIYHSANLAFDSYKALQEAGHNVDFNFPELNNYMREYQSMPQHSSFYNFFKGKVDKVRSLLGMPISTFNGVLLNKGLAMYVPDEENPFVDPIIFANNIKKKYDLILFFFLEGIISTSTIREIYNKHKCLILMQFVDMYPMTGGCYYFNQCKGLYNECRYCLIFGGKKKNTKAYNNFLIKKKNYQDCKIVGICNSWMKGFADKTGLFANDQLIVSQLALDEFFYKPLDKHSCLRDLNINEGKAFIILLRFRNLPRKGCEYAESAIKRFLSNLSDSERDSVLLLTIGDNCSWKLDIEIQNLGIVNAETLVKVYNAATLFLCPSIDDAGPSMINQSEMCGTPVVAFDSGAAVDVVITGKTGYKAKYKEVDDMAHGLYYMFSQTETKLENMRISTRNFAMSVNSKKAYADLVEEIYLKHNS